MAFLKLFGTITRKVSFSKKIDHVFCLILPEYTEHDAVKRHMLEETGREGKSHQGLCSLPYKQQDT